MSLSVTPELLKGVQAFLSFINDGISIEGIFAVDDVCDWLRLRHGRVSKSSQI